MNYMPESRTWALGADPFPEVVCYGAQEAKVNMALLLDGRPDPICQPGPSQEGKSM